MTPGVYKYQRIDVFSDRPFCGNPLAVFTDAQGLDDASMRRIARELHLSETAFVFPTGNSLYDYAVRVFTPTTELPTSEGPSLGTVFALAHEEKLRDTNRVVLEESGGPVSVTLVSPMITMKQPCPVMADIYDDVEAALGMLCLARTDMHPGAPVHRVRCGAGFTLVPLKDLDALGRVVFRPDIWQRTLARTPFATVVAYVPNVGAHAARARVFAPGIGVMEDPATGTACGALAAALVECDLVTPSAARHLVVGQGVEMGRPSQVHVMLKCDGKKPASLRIGGLCVWTGRGEIHVVDELGSVRGGG